MFYSRLETDVQFGSLSRRAAVVPSSKVKQALPWGFQNFDTCLRKFYTVLLPVETILRNLMKQYSNKVLVQGLPPSANTNHQTPLYATSLPVLSKTYIDAYNLQYTIPGTVIQLESHFRSKRPCLSSQHSELRNQHKMHSC